MSSIVVHDTVVQVIELGVVGPQGPQGPTGLPGAGASGFLLAVATKTGAYTLTANDELILADATAAAFDLTLPPAASMPRKVFRFRKIDASANLVTIRAPYPELIDFMPTTTLDGPSSALSMASNGVGWYVFSALGEFVSDAGGAWDFSSWIQSGHLVTAGI